MTDEQRTRVDGGRFEPSDEIVVVYGSPGRKYGERVYRAADLAADALARVTAERDKAQREHDEARARVARLEEALERLTGDVAAPYPDWYFAGEASDREAAMQREAREALAVDSEARDA